MSSFLEKYSPKQISEFVGQKLALSSLITYLDKPGNKKAVIVYGPPGTGKTSSIYAVAREMDYELVELNSDDIRDKENLDAVLGNTIMTASIFGKKKVILLDELECMSSGNITKLIEFIKKTRIPIILVASDLWEQKFKFLRLYCEKIEYRKINSRSIAKKLREIADSENLPFEQEFIEEISKNSDGDLRAAIIDLETEAGVKIFKNEGSFKLHRDLKRNVFDAVQKIFKSDFSRNLTEVFEESGVDVRTGMLWLAENICKGYKDAKEISEAYNFLSRSDVFMGRIKKRQYWRFQYYSKILSTAGVNLSRINTQHGFVKYAFPSKLLKLSESKNQRTHVKNIGKKIAPKIHSSSRIFARDYLSLFKIMMKKEPLLKKKIAEFAELTPTELKYLAE